jgi:hypothetical protein
LRVGAAQQQQTAWFEAALHISVLQCDVITGSWDMSISRRNPIQFHSISFCKTQVGWSGV